MLIEGETCQTCSFLRAVKDQKEINKVTYFCWRNPPSPMAVSQMTPHGMHVQIISSRAPTQLHETCGEHRPIPAPANVSALLTS